MPSEMGETFKAMRGEKVSRRAARAIAQKDVITAALQWAEAHGLTVLSLPYGFQYVQGSKILNWWPSSGRVFPQGLWPDVKSLARLPGSDGGNFLAVLKAAFGAKA